MRYKLIAIDLDGTLLTDKKMLLEENIKVLQILNSKGIEIVIATGRRYWEAKSFAEKLKINPVILSNNGTIVRNMLDDKVLATKYLDKESFYDLIKEGRKRGLYPILHVDHYDEGYDIIIELDKSDNRYSTYLSKVLTRFEQTDDLLNYKEPKILSVTYTGDIEKLEEFQKEIELTFSHKYNSHIMNNLTKIGPLLEIMNPQGSKWISLIEYAREKGIEDKSIVAIGDDNNDIEMIKKAGLGIAMRNSSIGVKEVADITTDKTNNEAGVADVLKRIFKINEL